MDANPRDSLCNTKVQLNKVNNKVDIDNHQFVCSHTHINYDEARAIDRNINHDDVHVVDSYVNVFYVEDNEIDNNFYQPKQHNIDTNSIISTPYQSVHTVLVWYPLFIGYKINQQCATNTTSCVIM